MSSLIWIFFMRKIYISGKFFFKAYTDAMINELAVFVKLSAEIPHKFIPLNKKGKIPYLEIAKKCELSESHCRKHIKTLLKEGLLFIKDNSLHIISNKNIQEKYGKGRTMYFTNLSLKQIKNTIKVVPVLSNLRSQSKTIEYKKGISITKVLIDEGKIYNPKLIKKILKIERSRDLKYSEKITLSNNSINNLTNTRSKSTAIRYKKLGKELLCFQTIRDYQVLCTGISKDTFLSMKQKNIIPFYSKYNNGNILVDRANIFLLRRGFVS